MPDTLSEIVAAGLPVSIGESEYFLKPLRARDWGEAAAYLDTRRPTPLTTVKPHLAGLTEVQQKHLLTLAYNEERSAVLYSPREVGQWFDTPEGGAFKFWLQVRQRHPEISLERAGELLLLAGTDELLQLARRGKKMEGLPEGNSLGSAESPRTTPGQEPSPGGGSSANSAESAAGPPSKSET